jgi:hypothetical protein
MDVHARGYVNVVSTCIGVGCRYYCYCLRGVIEQGVPNTPTITDTLIRHLSSIIPY